MPDVLSDPSNATYVVAFAAAVVAAFVWFRNRDRRSLAAVLVAVAALGLLFLCDRLFESPREGAVRGVTAISEAINARDWKAFEGNVSESFSAAGFGKAKFVEAVRASSDQFKPRTAAWEFKVPDDIQPAAADEVVIEFEGKAEAAGNPFLAHFVAAFVKDPDGRWRLKAFTAYDYVQKRQPIALPGIR